MIADRIKDSRPLWRWYRRSLWLGLILAVLWAFRGPLLRGTARLLIVDQTLRNSTAVVLLEGVDGGTGFDEVASIYHQGYADRILLLESPPSRLEQLEIIPQGRELALRELTKRGVPAEGVTTLPVDRPSQWSGAARLGQWLVEDNSRTVTALCGDFSSRKLRHICEEMMPAEVAARIHWRSLADRRFDETNWWQDKFGVLAVSQELVSLAHVCVLGRPEEESGWLDPKAYERLAKERIGMGGGRESFIRSAEGLLKLEVR